MRSRQRLMLPLECLVVALLLAGCGAAPTRLSPEPTTPAPPLAAPVPSGETTTPTGTATVLAAVPTATHALQGPAYTNPVLDTDFPDPTVIRARDGWYYAYATQTLTAERRVNIQVARSKDLVRWKLLRDVLPEKPVWASTTQDFWAPHVSQSGGRYYMYYSSARDGREGMCLGVANARGPAGPFRDVGRPLLCGEGFAEIDPMAFDDPKTGKRLLYWGSDSKPIRVRELAPDRTRFAPGSKPREILPAGTDAYERLVEGAWVVYRHGWYYLFCSGDRCCGNSPTYATMVARSRAATGSFEKLAAARDELSSVILQLNVRWDAPGHNSVITDEAGNDWMVYHAIDTRQRYLKTGNPEDQAVRRPMLIDRGDYRDGWMQVGDGTPSTGPMPATSVR